MLPEHSGIFGTYLGKFSGSFGEIALIRIPCGIIGEADKLVQRD